MITYNFLQLSASVIGKTDFNLHSLTDKNFVIGNSELNFTTDKEDTSINMSNDPGLGIRLLLGSGSTPATPDDVNLESTISAYQVVSQTHQLNNGYGSTILTINRLVKNNTESDISISEMGLFTTASYYGYGSGAAFLLAREVLPEPVTLHPGEKHTFTMTISLE